MDELQIRYTLARYGQLLDDGRFDEWVDCFTEDVTFGVMGQVVHGRDGVRGVIEPYQPAEARGCHMLSEPLIELDGDRAVVTTDYCFVTKDLKVLSSGRYHDVFARQGDRWRIAVREIVFLGEEPMGIEGGA